MAEAVGKRFAKSDEFCPGGWEQLSLLLEWFPKRKPALLEGR